MNTSFGQIYTYNAAACTKEKFKTAQFVESFSLDALPKDKITWINFYMYDDLAPIEAFCKKAKLDSLVFQNIRDRDYRPQFEDYDHYLFFSVRSATPTTGKMTRIFEEQLSFVLGEHYLISFQSKPSDYFGSVRDRLENGKGLLREKGAELLLYRLLDSIVDNYFYALEGFTTEISELESKVSKSSTPEILSFIESHKRKHIEFRRIVAPLKEIAISLENSENKLFKRETKHYFSDLKQNCISITEEVESNKNALEGLANLYYAVQGQRMNEIMKMLTIVSTIFIPLTFLAGIYGMNFDNMPELRTKYGYFATWGVMVLIAVGLLYYFRRKGWLGRK
ncbi:MAG TPA: magnesium/cobalt transporter CorA [Taishania sp.]|nr:magnesium/cobalt transporter CorA [Taishania sp.]